MLLKRCCFYAMIDKKGGEEMQTNKKLPSKAVIITAFVMSGVFLILMYILCINSTVQLFKYGVNKMPVGAFIADVLFMAFASAGGLLTVKRYRESMKGAGTFLKVYSIVQLGYAGTMLNVILFVTVIIKLILSIPRPGIF